MGFDVTLVHLEDVAVGDLTRLGLTPSGRTITGAEATSPDAPVLAVLTTSRGLLLADPSLVLITDLGALARTLGTRVARISMDDLGHGSCIVRPDGAERAVVWSAGRTKVDDGEPVPEESGVDELDPIEVVQMLEELTGVELHEPLLQERFEVLTSSKFTPSGAAATSERAAPTPVAEPTPARPPRPRKGLFSRLFGG